MEVSIKLDYKDILNKMNKGNKHRFWFISGVEGSGKTKAAIGRALYLQDNYCIRENEDILIVSSEDLKDTLENVKNETRRDNTLFSLLNNNIEIYSIKTLISCYFKELSSKLGDTNKRFCKGDIVHGIILNGISELRHSEMRINKIIMSNNIDFLSEEILYMKYMNIDSLSEYQKLNRKKRGQSLRKNSKSREAVHKLYKWYCNYMSDNGLIDYIDEFNMVYDNRKYLNDMKYAHIIVDNVEQLTIKELAFIRGLLKDLTYSSFSLVKNSNVTNIKNPWFEHFKRNKDIQAFDDNKYKFINCSAIQRELLTKKKNRDIKESEIKRENRDIKEAEIKKKSNGINEDETKVQTKEEDNMQNRKTVNEYLEAYKYVDFKHNVSHNFAIDTSSYNEVILDPDTTSEIIGEKEINKIPVYNEIAAGQPISINDEIEGTFNLPIYWLKGVKQPFILKIKGDSMVNIDIEDGDYVVINKQTMANHNEIVAVSIDGDATLKRLWLKGNKAVLMPENDKYSPIEIKEDNAYIIGKAVGLIKTIH